MKLILSLIALSSFLTHADCRQELVEEKLSLKQERNTGLKSYATIGPALGGLLFIVNPIAGGSLISILASDIIHDSARTKSRERLIETIDQAYAYDLDQKIGPVLNKVIKKVQRQSTQSLSSEEIVKAIILANENGDICQLKRRNIRKLSQEIAIDLD